MWLCLSYMLCDVAKVENLEKECKDELDSNYGKCLS